MMLGDKTDTQDIPALSASTIREKNKDGENKERATGDFFLESLDLPSLDIQYGTSVDMVSTCIERVPVHVNQGVPYPRYRQVACI